MKSALCVSCNLCMLKNLYLLEANFFLFIQMRIPKLWSNYIFLTVIYRDKQWSTLLILGTNHLVHMISCHGTVSARV